MVKYVESVHACHSMGLWVVNIGIIQKLMARSEMTETNQSSDLC